MTSSRDPVILVLLIIVILVAAGWLVASITIEKPTPSSLPVTSIRSIPTTPIPSSGYWIKIDPISDKQIGEIFTVNSTTNLSAGNEILVQIYKTDFHPGGSREEFLGIVGKVKVIPGNNKINTSSFIVNSSELYPFPRKYNFIESAINEDVTGVAQFNIT
jgi:hypothetical protein